VASGGTGVSTSTGTTNVVLSNSPTIVTPVIAQINDANGNETLKLASIASAVNEISIENAATGNPVHIRATGGDASVGLHLVAKGASGYVNVTDGVDETKRLMFNASGGTTNTRTMLSSTQTVDRTLTLPDATGTLLYGGGPLGTPSSGTVTNLTGTASININGTVGATTASTGAFTTLSASGLSTLSSGAAIRGNTAPASGVGLELVYDGTQSVIQSYNRTSPAYQPLWLEGGTLVRIGLGGSAIAGFTSTGLGIGTTSPAASASSTATVEASGCLVVGGAINAHQTNRAVFQYSVNDTTIRSYGATAGTGAIAFNTGGGGGSADTERMRITSSGNVGIGTTSPAEKLHVVGGNIAVDSGIRKIGYITDATASNTGYIIPYDASGFLSIHTNFSSGGIKFHTSTSNTERMRIDSSGNVGIGTSSPYLSRLHIQKSESGASPAAVLRVSNSGAGYTSKIVLTDENTNDANISYIGATGSLGFGLGTSLTQMVLTSAGNLLVGTTTASASPATGVQLCNTSGTLGGVFIGHDTGTANGNYYATFAYASGIIGSITQSTTSAVLYNTTSDYRRKSNVKDLTGSGAFIDALKPRTFDWDTGDKGVGFIAHEFAEVSPSSVSGEKDAVDEEGKPKYQGMQASSAEVIANLVAEIQELRKRMAAVEGK
jgi:hypothetical protein